MDVKKKGKLKNVLLLITIVALILCMPTYVSALSNKGGQKVTGKVVSLNIGIYRDRACKQEITFIDWGTISPSSTVSFPLYIKNLGTVQATLQMTTLNWNPLNSSEYLSLSWDYAGKPIKPNEVVPLTLKLTVSSNIKNLQAFSFDINIISYG